MSSGPVASRQRTLDQATYSAKEAASDTDEATRFAAADSRWTWLIVTTMRAGEATKNAISPSVRCERRSRTPAWASPTPPR